MRKLAIFVAVGLLVVHVSVNAQTRPSFAGVWTLLADRTTPPDALPLGPEVRIEHTAGSLTITSPATSFRVVTRLATLEDHWSVSPGGLKSIVYELDGLPHDRPAPAVQGSAGRTENVSYRATWADAQLIIVTRDTRHITADPRNPVFMDRSVRQVLSLDANRDLVMETLIAVQQGPEPVPMRAVYRKSQ